MGSHNSLIYLTMAYVIRTFSPIYVLFSPFFIYTLLFLRIFALNTVTDLLGQLDQKRLNSENLLKVA